MPATPMPNLVQIRTRGLLGKWVKYNYLFIYLFIPFYFMNFTKFSTLMQNGPLNLSDR